MTKRKGLRKEFNEQLKAAKKYLRQLKKDRRFSMNNTDLKTSWTKEEIAAQKEKDVEIINTITFIQDLVKGFER